MQAVSYAKILHHIFITTIYENFKLVFLPIWDERKFQILYACLICLIQQLKELKQFRGTFTGKYFNKSTLSQKCNFIRNDLNSTREIVDC